MKRCKPIGAAALLIVSSSYYIGTMPLAAQDWREDTFPPPNAGRLVFAITPDGNPECASYDGVNCLWGQSMRDIDFSRVRPLVCGAAHRKLYGVTGFEDPKHWCNLALGQAQAAPAPAAPAPAPAQPAPAPAQPAPVQGTSVRFDRPLFKNGPERVDVCDHFGTACGQPAADDYCRVMGFQRASSWEPEHASPTKVLNLGKVCTGDPCTGFKFVVCFTKGQRGPVSWPGTFD